MHESASEGVGEVRGGADASVRARLHDPVGEQAPVDLRLGFGAIVAWLTALAVLPGPPQSAALAAGFGAVAGGAGFVVTRWAGARRSAIGRRVPPRLRPIAAMLALAGFSVLLVCAPLAARLSRAADSPAHGLAAAGAERTVQLRVVQDPRPLAGSGPGGQLRVIVPAELDGVGAGGDVAVSGRVLVFGAAADWDGTLPGTVVRVGVRFAPATGDGLLVALLDARAKPVVVTPAPWWQQWAGSVRRSLQQACRGLPDQVRGLLPGLVDGDTSGLDPVLANQFKVAGLTHLVAVSGTNCAILIGAVLLLLRRLSAGPWLCGSAATVVVAAFVIVARPSPSVLRAAVMAGIAIAALVAGRPRSGIPVLAAAVLVLLVHDPSLAADAGFAMSVLATGALLLVAPRWANALRSRGIPPLLADALAVATAAHLVTAPVVAALTGRISLVAIPANVLAEPVVALTTILGFGAAVIAPFWLGGGAGLAQLAGWPCRWLVGVAGFFGTVDGASMPWPSGFAGALLLIAASGGVLLLLRWRQVRHMFAVALVTGALVQIPVRHAASGWPAPGTVLVACDVGQGDGLVLPLPDRQAIVVDTGPDPVGMDRCLRDLGVTGIPLLVLTHMHADHVGGLAGALRGRAVGRVVTGPLDEPEAGVAAVRSILSARRVVLERATPGASFDDDGVHLDVLGPRFAYHGTRSDPNNSSVVLRVTVRGIRLLLLGDAEQEAQQGLLDEHTDLRADVVKIAHHGSAYVAPALLAAVHARLALISVGAHNDYGLPAPSLLNDLNRLGIPVLRTDQDGDIAAVIDPDDHMLRSVRRPVPVTSA